MAVCQGNFDCFAISKQNDAADDGSSGCLTHFKDSYFLATEDRVGNTPVHTICKFKLSQLQWQQMVISDLMMTTASRNVKDSAAYEPAKFSTLAAPPKRFYRRFWASVARRLLESEKEAIFAGIKASRV